MIPWPVQQIAGRVTIYGYPRHDRIPRKCRRIKPQIGSRVGKTRVAYQLRTVRAHPIKVRVGAIRNGER